MAAITICSDFGAPKNKVWHCFPIYFPWSYGTRCQHVFHFHDRPLKTCVAWGSPEEKEDERTGVRHGSFSGKVIFSEDSQSVLPELPFSGLANHVRLWSVLSDSCTCTLTSGLSSPLRSHLPMTRWPGPCEEAPLGTVLDRASHSRVWDGVSVLLGSRDCLGPIWMHCLVSVNQGKETAPGVRGSYAEYVVKSRKRN